MTPQLNHHYRKNGFEFRVDAIADGQVYVSKWLLADHEKGKLIRVPLEVWESEMDDAEVLEKGEE